MNKIAVTLCIAAAMVAGTFVLAQAQNQTTPASGDPRIDKVIEQNQQILKNQQEIINQLKDVREGLMQLRRRSS